MTVLFLKSSNVYIGLRSSISDTNSIFDRVFKTVSKFVLKNVEFCYAPFDIKKVKMKSLHPVHLPNRPRKSVGWSLVFERKSQIGLCFL